MVPDLPLVHYAIDLPNGYVADLEVPETVDDDMEHQEAVLHRPAIEPVVHFHPDPEGDEVRPQHGAFEVVEEGLHMAYHIPTLTQTSFGLIDDDGIRLPYLGLHQPADELHLLGDHHRIDECHDGSMLYLEDALFLRPFNRLLQPPWDGHSGRFDQDYVRTVAEVQVDDRCGERSLHLPPATSLTLRWLDSISFWSTLMCPTSLTTNATLLPRDSSSLASLIRNMVFPLPRNPVI